MNTEERLDRLEKQNANLRRGLVGLLLLVVVVPLAAFVWQDKQPKTIKCDRLEANIVSAGYVKTRMLQVMSNDPKQLITLAATEDRMDVMLAGPGSKQGVRLVVFDGTGKEKAGARVKAWSGKGSAELDAGNMGPSVKLKDADATIRAVLGTTVTEDRITGAETHDPPSTLTLYDRKGSVLHQVPR